MTSGETIESTTGESSDGASRKRSSGLNSLLLADLKSMAGGLGIRTTAAGEPFGADGHPLAAGRLVVADSGQVHSLLFGATAPGHEVTARTRHVTLYSVAVEGVPSIHVEEALWVTGEVLTAG